MDALPARVSKPRGYRCYHSGKWHIKTTALRGAGFDHSYMLLDQNRYFTPRLQIWMSSRCRPSSPARASIHQGNRRARRSSS